MTNDRNAGRYFAQVFLAIAFLITACAQDQEAGPVDNTTTSGAILASSQTAIVIDGNNQDWGDYPTLSLDPVADNADGSSDLGNIKAFTNDQYLYLLIDFYSRGGDEEIRVEIKLVDDIVARLSIDPQTYRIQLRNPISSAPLEIPSQLFWGNSLEVKIPLVELGGEVASLQSVEARLNMLDTGDSVSGGEVYQSDEIDVIQFVDSREQPVPTPEPVEFSLGDYFKLPDNYEARVLFSPPAPDLIAITKSQDGTIFLQHGSLNAGISTLNPETGGLTRIYNLPVGEQVSYIVGGPADQVFVTIYGQGIFLISAKGQAEKWSDDRGMVLYYTQDGKAIGTDYGKTIVTEYYEGGGVSNTIATNFTHVYDLVVGLRGSIFISDFQSGDIIRIDPDGERTILVDQLLPYDPMDIAFGPEETLFVSTAAHGLLEVDTESGGYEVKFPQGSTCALRDGDFVFIEDDTVMFTDPGAGLVTTLNLSNGEFDLVVGNLGITRGAAIGPDQSVYFGMRGCKGISNAQVMRMDQEGNIEVAIDGLVGQEIDQLVFDPNGGLYITLHDVGVSFNILYFPTLDSAGVAVPGGSGIHSIAVDPTTGHLFGTNYNEETITEFTPEGVVRRFAFSPPENSRGHAVAFSGTGQLYVQALEDDVFDKGPIVKTWILSVNKETGESEVFFSYPRNGTLPFRVLTADVNGNVWWIVNPEFVIERIDAEGNDLLFAQNLPIDSAAIAVDANENVYIFSVGGIFGFFPK